MYPNTQNRTSHLEQISATNPGMCHIFSPAEKVTPRRDAYRRYTSIDHCFDARIVVGELFVRRQGALDNELWGW